MRREARSPRGGEVLTPPETGWKPRWARLQPPPPPAPPAAAPGRRAAARRPRAAAGPRQEPGLLPPAAPAAPSLRRLVVLDQQEAEQAQEALERVEDGGEHQAALVVLQLAARELALSRVPLGARRAEGRAGAGGRRARGRGRGPRPARAAAGGRWEYLRSTRDTVSPSITAPAKALRTPSMKTRTPSRSRFWLLTGPEARRRPRVARRGLRSPGGDLAPGPGPAREGASRGPQQSRAAPSSEGRRPATARIESAGGPLPERLRGSSRPSERRGRRRRR